MDIFCLLCGNPSHSSFVTIALIKEKIKSYYEMKNTKGRKNYSYLHYMKPIVDVYEKDPELFTQNIETVKKITKWMNNCTFLTIDNKIIHNCKNPYDVYFRDSNNYDYVTSGMKNDYDNRYGEFVHTSCWKFIKKTFNIKLNFSHFPIKHKIGSYYKVLDIDYGKIEKYWDQDFNFISVIMNSDMDLLDDPLISNKNQYRIKNIFNKLKLRIDKNRKSPVTSATSYNSNTYKIGNNKNIWIVQSGKWKEVNEDTVEIKIEINKNNKILRKIYKYIGEPNNIPIFIKSFKNKRNTVEFNIITTNNYYESIRNKLP